MSSTLGCILWAQTAFTYGWRYASAQKNHTIGKAVARQSAAEVTQGFVD